MTESAKVDGAYRGTVGADAPARLRKFLVRSVLGGLIHGAPGSVLRMR